MDADCYQIDVLHFLNPHLIWVEVVDKSRDQQDIFEQIGIYGLLPYDLTIDIDGTLIAQRCEEWAAVTNVTMKKAFSEAKQIWFRPKHIDRRTSIFDDNIHKYGEIFFANSKNVVSELSDILVHTGFALSDVSSFHQELSCGNLKTKLNFVKAMEVITNLKKCHGSSTKSRKDIEMSIKKNTVVFHEAEKLMLELSDSNLRKPQLSTSEIYNIVEKKCKDFEWCKDIDEESVGRAVSKRHVGNHKIVKDDANDKQEARKVPTLLKRMLELHRNKTVKTN